MKSRINISGVLGLAINEKHQFLLSQRNEPEHKDMHLKWQLPGGGTEFGEQPEDTLNREFEEELSLKPTILFPYPIVKSSTRIHQEKEISLLLLVFIVTIGQQIPKIKDPETLDWKWCDINEIYRLDCLPLTNIFVDKAAHICNQYSLWSALGVIK